MELREFQIGPKPAKTRVVINLRDFGFVGTVSDKALAEIEANERRAAMVLTTAHKYWFR